MTRNLKWNCFEFSKVIIFQIDFYIAINHAKFLATMLDDKINKTRRKRLVATIVYWNFHYTMRNWLKIIKSFIVISSAKSNDFMYNFVCHIRIIWLLTMQLYFDWFFVNFIECEISIVFLILNYIAFKQNSITCFCWNYVFLSKSSWNFFLTRMFWYAFIEINVRSIIDVFDISIWKRNDYNRCFRIVFSNTTWM